MTIDWWTLGLEAVNVAVLIWLLGRFFWKPVAAMITQRRAAATRDLDAAAASRAAADKALAEANAARAGLAAERAAMLATATADAGKTRDALLAQAKAEAQTARDAAAADLVKERAGAMSALQNDAALLAVDIAARLLGRLDGRAVHAAFLDGLTGKIAALPEDARRRLADAPLRLVSATPLTADEQTNYQSRLESVLGKALQLAFDSDPKLVAGLSLACANLVVADNWRADLDHILAELRHD